MGYRGFDQEGGQVIGLASRVPGYMAMRSLGWPRLAPLNLTVSVTFNCNSRCLTCNIWSKKNAVELSLEEFDKTFKSVGRSPYWVTVSGGEPFLRGDLGDVVESACTRMKPSVVTIPTNGLVSDVAERAGIIADSCPNTSFVINLSLDGVGKEHDKIRGVPGAFEKALETFRGLRSLERKNLSVGVHTVVSRFNAEKIPDIFDYVKNELKPDSYITEIAENRVELDTMESEIAPAASDYKVVAAFLRGKLGEEKKSGLPAIIGALRSEYYGLALKTVSEKRQAIPCYAGIFSAQISPSGDVWPCCVRADVLGNLRDADYDFKKIWFSKKADEIRKSIKNRECFCPLANASYTNMLANPGTLVRVLLHAV